MWRQRKLGHDTYEEYLVLCRDGYVTRKRALVAIKEAELQAATEAEILANAKRSKQTLYKPMKEFPVLIQWRDLFAKDAPDALRFPILVLVAPSHCGKTELAMSLFKAPLKVQIGNLVHFPDRMRDFQRGHRDGIVVDDVRDLSFVVQHQEEISGEVLGAGGVRVVALRGVFLRAVFVQDPHGRHHRLQHVGHRAAA